jgi:hypothetical protein
MFKQLSTSFILKNICKLVFFFKFFRNVYTFPLLFGVHFKLLLKSTHLSIILLKCTRKQNLQNFCLAICQPYWIFWCNYQHMPYTWCRRCTPKSVHFHTWFQKVYTGLTRCRCRQNQVRRVQILPSLGGGGRFISCTFNYWLKIMHTSGYANDFWCNQKWNSANIRNSVAVES